ncbi:acetamidase/formamidase family protein [Streptomyces sp. SPB074]|uniref:acetamidase/formamidase family protein n=1 Tax=Streptomyces sp. (strain SPB074) TaxID=465543 RepID=UPI001F17ECED|nr:acetamidase/formamidase family protein [Streptomyces sp. SPB074]
MPATAKTVHWGRLPCRSTPPVAEIPSGGAVTLDTVSHEGILEDQGRDPVAFFGAYGVRPEDVLSDARELAASHAGRDPARDGPHVVTGPVHVTSARPGDVLRVETLSLRRRAGYGIVSTRHGRGALPGEFALRGPEFTFCRTEGDTGLIGYGAGRAARFPLAPFLGLTGVATASEEPAHSVPPGRHGGNLDIKHLVTGSTLYLPVQVEGAGFHAGDPH